MIRFVLRKLFAALPEGRFKCCGIILRFHVIHLYSHWRDVKVEIHEVQDKGHDQTGLPATHIPSAFASCIHEIRRQYRKRTLASLAELAV